MPNIHVSDETKELLDNVKANRHFNSFNEIITDWARQTGAYRKYAPGQEEIGNESLEQPYTNITPVDILSFPTPTATYIGDIGSGKTTSLALDLNQTLQRRPNTEAVCLSTTSHFTGLRNEYPSSLTTERYPEVNPLALDPYAGEKAFSIQLSNKVNQVCDFLCHALEPEVEKDPSMILDSLVLSAYRDAGFSHEAAQNGEISIEDSPTIDDVIRFAKDRAESPEDHISVYENETIDQPKEEIDVDLTDTDYGERQRNLYEALGTVFGEGGQLSNFNTEKRFSDLIGDGRISVVQTEIGRPGGIVPHGVLIAAYEYAKLQDNPVIVAGDDIEAGEIFRVAGEFTSIINNSAEYGVGAMFTGGTLNQYSVTDNYGDGLRMFSHMLKIHTYGNRITDDLDETLADKFDFTKSHFDFLNHAADGVSHEYAEALVRFGDRNWVGVRTEPTTDREHRLV